MGFEAKAPDPDPPPWRSGRAHFKHVTTDQAALARPFFFPVGSMKISQKQEQRLKIHLNILRILANKKLKAK